MRVLHWYPNFLAGGGVASALLGLARAQARIGAEVLVGAVLPERGMAPSTVPGCTLLCWKPTWTLGAGTRLLRGMGFSDQRRFARTRPDIVHVHGDFAPDNFRVRGLFRCPRIISPHGSFHAQVLRKHGTTKNVYLGIARRSLHRGAAFHALSPSEADAIRRVVPGAEVFIFPNGPSPAMQEYMTSGPVPWRVGPVTFLFAGRLDVFHKGLDIALDAFSLACKRLRETDLLLVLAGPDVGGGRHALEERARILGVDRKVRFAGRLEADDLSRVYREADVYLQVSRNDGFPLSVVDALLMGIPAILSTEVGITSYQGIGVLPHVAAVRPDAEKVAGTMVDFVRNLGTLSQQARSSRAKVLDLFSWERAAAASLEAYRGLVERDSA
jgi:glycosyltransferase involved in cell wall biosynthesis